MASFYQPAGDGSSGEPIPPEELFGAGDADETLSAAYARVVGEVQRLVDR